MKLSNVFATKIARQRVEMKAPTLGPRPIKAAALSEIGRIRGWLESTSGAKLAASLGVRPPETPGFHWTSAGEGILNSPVKRQASLVLGGSDDYPKGGIAGPLSDLICKTFGVDASSSDFSREFSGHIQPYLQELSRLLAAEGFEVAGWWSASPKYTQLVVYSPDLAKAVSKEKF